MNICNVYTIERVFCLVLSVTAFAASIQTSYAEPSNADLYSMIMEIKEENRSLKEEIRHLKEIVENRKKKYQQITTDIYPYSNSNLKTNKPEYTDNIYQKIDKKNFEFNYEALFLGNNIKGTKNSSDFEFSYGSRYEVSLFGNKEIGLRARVFNYDDDFVENVDYGSSSYYLDYDAKYSTQVESYDVEFIRELLNNDHFSLNGSIGARYASLINEQNYYSEDSTYLYDNEHNGFGPTFALEGAYDLGFVTVVGSIRQSFEKMSTSNDLEAYSINGNVDETGVYDLTTLGLQTELSVGLELAETLPNGLQIFGGLGGEYQYWSVSGTEYYNPETNCGGHSDCIGVSDQTNYSVSEQLELFGLKANIGFRF